MLVLTVKPKEAVIIIPPNGDRIIIKNFHKESISMGFQAKKEYKILREKLTLNLPDKKGS